MTDILDLRHYGHGTVIFAGYQESGRGRVDGRKWLADHGRNLLMTIQLNHSRMVHPFYQVPLLTGLGIARFLEDRFQLKGEIKWPNDVLVQGKKISGILCESRGEFISVGIGLNCGQQTFESSVADKSTSLSLLTGRDIKPDKILGELLEELRDSYVISNWRKEISRRLYCLDREVILQEGAAGSGNVSQVIIKGLSGQGFLQVKDKLSGELKEVLAGEIQFPGYISG